ncbi:MAG: GntR family transcriptional regulator [Propionivibrio sp.]
MAEKMKSSFALATPPLMLQDVAYSRLKELIVSGELPPGTFFSERQMAQMLEMSTSPVRAALKRLSSDGFVVISAQRGVSVKTLSVKELNDIFEYRLALESFVVAQLCMQRDLPTLDSIEANLREQLNSAEQDDITRHAHLDVSFHILLCDAHGNQEISNALRLLKDRLNQVAARVTRNKTGRSIDNYREHYELFQLIRQGKKNEAVDMLGKHLEFARQFYFDPENTLML